jgi:hypothetical protein
MVPASQMSQAILTVPTWIPQSAITGSTRAQTWHASADHKEITGTSTLAPTRARAVSFIKLATKDGKSVLPQRQSDWIEFQSHARAWRQSRPKGSSSAQQVAGDLNYLRIIDMSARAVPCLLKQLESELEAGKPDHWFIALWITTKGANPVPPESRGKMREMARAWVEWGKKEGLLDAGVGGAVSASR